DTCRPGFGRLETRSPNFVERQPLGKVSGHCETNASRFEADYHRSKTLIRLRAKRPLGYITRDRDMWSNDARSPRRSGDRPQPREITRPWRPGAGKAAYELMSSSVSRGVFSLMWMVEDQQRTGQWPDVRIT